MKYSIPYLIILIVIAFFLGRSCGQVDGQAHNRVNVDSIVKSIRKQEKVIAVLEKKSNIQHDTIYKEHHHYHVIRRDSLIPCETKLVVCDTILVHDSIHDTTQDLIIAKQDTVIKEWNLVHAQDSATIGGLKKENKKLRRQMWFWKALNVVQSAGNLYQVGKH